MHDDAVQEYNEAIAQFGYLAYRHPDNPDYRQRLGYCHNWLGETLRLWLASDKKPEKFTADDARSEYAAAIKLQQELHQRAPANRTYQQDLARTYYNRGILLYQGHVDPTQADAARDDFVRAAELLQPLVTSPQSPAASPVASPVGSSVASASNGPDPSQDLARAYNNLGRIYLDRQSFEEAGQLYEQAILTLNILRQKDPDNREYKTEAAHYYNNLALALASEHQFTLATKPSDDARILTEELAAPSPSVEDLHERILKLRAWIDSHASASPAKP